MPANCLFCNLFETRRAADFESDLFWAKLDIHPVSPGHLLLIPKRHIIGLDDLKRSEIIDLHRIRNGAVTLLNTGKKEDLRKAYEKLLDAPITPNSVWFINHALAHPRFGTQPDGYNDAVNYGAAAGQTVPHLHWHLIPRYAGDVADPKGGIRYVIPEMGNYTDPRE
jgi:diadenosine tetraphosphate (Ap4A) HIT family hydrolase